MKITFRIGQNGGILTVQREENDPKAIASGYTRHVHGWGEEIHLLHLIKTELNRAGFNLASVKLGRDGHLMGDDNMRYLRTPATARRKRPVSYPYLWIVDGNWAVRSSAKAFNAGEIVRFDVTGDIFHDDYPQADWAEKVKTLCDEAGIECEVQPKEGMLFQPLNVTDLKLEPTSHDRTGTKNRGAA